VRPPTHAGYRSLATSGQSAVKHHGSNGWWRGADAGFSVRHPELVTGKATIKLGLDKAARIPDGESRDLLRAAFVTLVRCEPERSGD
jgi:hypothetical protein